MKKRLCVYVLLICTFFTSCSILEHINPEFESDDYRQYSESNNDSGDYRRFSEVFLDVFDTITVVSGYAASQEEFDYFSQEVIRDKLLQLHQLFDIFNEYPGINNLHTINNYAGIAPVEGDPVIIELLLLSIEAYHISDGLLNVAIGPVTQLWHEAGEELLVPSMEDLLAASEFTDINDLIINEEMGTVFLQKENMSLDVGAIAKGFAVELAALAAIESGFNSFTLTVGGDVRVTESPPGDQEAWNIGVSNPEGGDVLDIISVTNTSVFSSGNYLRYFVVDDMMYHHIIDPRTLMPATGHKSVSVVYPDGAMADILSLVAFILDTDEAKEFLACFEAEGIWVLHDGTLITTQNWDEL
jgi:thiamine biosynthesis lipoprotein